MGLLSLLCAAAFTISTNNQFKILCQNKLRPAQYTIMYHNFVRKIVNTVNTKLTCKWLYHYCQPEMSVDFA